MIQSLRYSQLTLRIGLALASLWMGIGAFLMPQNVEQFLRHLQVPDQFVYLLGLLAVLVAISLVSGFFLKLFASVALVLLLPALVLHGLDDASAAGVGLAGGFIALALWPERPHF